MTNLVLVTGATGFVGRQVLSELSASGARVKVVIREGSESRLAFLNAIDSIVTSEDIFAEDVDWWADVCKNVDTVIHCAWYAEPGKYLQSEKNFDCLIGTISIARGAVAAKVRRFIGIGTCFEYDLTPGILSIETPLRPLTPYAGAKAAAFMALSQYLPMQGMEFVWCRLFYLYGQGEDERRLVPYLRKNLSIGQPVELTSGAQIRDFMNVVDAGRAIVKFATGRLLGPVNICSGIAISVRSLAENIADEYGRRDLLQFGVRPDNLVDPAYVVGVRNDID